MIVQAKRLHAGEEVTVKAVNEIVKVVKTYQKGKYIMIDAMTRNGINSFYNDEVIR